ncbi:MAG: competence protein CoiA family protein [Promethearchaeota archaeon]
MFRRRKKHTIFHKKRQNATINSVPVNTPFKQNTRPLSSNESIYHTHMKRKIGELFQQTYSNCNLQEEVHTFDKSRKMDLFGSLNTKKFCIEAQVSFLTPEELLQRTLDYSKRGIYALWVLHAHPNYLPSFSLYELQQNLRKSKKILKRGENALPSKTFWRYSYNTTATERFLHALYGGKVYYFLKDQIIPVHFLKLYQIRYSYEENKPYRKYYRKGRVPITQNSLEDYHVRFGSSIFESKFFGIQFQPYEGQNILLAKFMDSIFWS